MNPFALAHPATLPEGVRLLQSDPRARAVAGGTNLVDLMRTGAEAPPLLVSLNRLPGLGRIDEVRGGGLRIGALARNADTAVHPLVRERYLALADALLAGASPQLRNAATAGGNLLQRTRCFYFRSAEWPCNRREAGSGCGARGGETRAHAVLGASEHCLATHPSDMCVALSALDASVRLAGPRGERSVPAASFHRLPGDAPQRETVMEPGEVVTAIELPPPDAAARRSSYLKLRERASYAFALVSVAAALDVSGGRVRAARIALGGVGTVPWRAREAEGVLAGGAAGEEAWRAAA